MFKNLFKTKQNPAKTTWISPSRQSTPQQSSSLPATLEFSALNESALEAVVGGKSVEAVTDDGVVIEYSRFDPEFGFRATPSRDEEIWDTGC